MTDLCKIENGIVTNRAHFAGDVPDGWIPDGETWIESEEAQIGWSYADAVFAPPSRPPEPDPDNYKPMIRRRAAGLQSEGNLVGALLLLKSIGE